MAYWDGTRWIAETPPRRQPQPRASRARDWTATILMLLGLAIIVVPLSLVGAARPTTAGCSVTPGSASIGATYVVSAWGLPTNSAINIWVTEGGTTTGRPLGGTPDGTFNLSQASWSAGVTTYAFSGPAKPHTKVYATCSVSSY
jgi:hypothetical protein